MELFGARDIISQMGKQQYNCIEYVYFYFGFFFFPSKTVAVTKSIPQSFSEGWSLLVGPMLREKCLMEVSKESSIKPMQTDIGWFPDGRYWAVLNITVYMKNKCFQ